MIRSTSTSSLFFISISRRRRNDHRIIEIYIILFESIKILYDRDYLSFVVNLYDAKELKSFPIADVKKIIDI